MVLINLDSFFRVDAACEGWIPGGDHRSGQAGGGTFGDSCVFGRPHFLVGPDIYIFWLSPNFLFLRCPQGIGSLAQLVRASDS